MFKLFLTTFLIVILLPTFGQGCFPDSNAIWNVHNLDVPPGEYPMMEIYYGLFNDTIISDTTYQKLYLLDDSIYSDTSLYKYLGAIRRDTLKVLFRPDGWNKNIILYDFSKGIGDTIRNGGGLTLFELEHEFAPSGRYEVITNIIGEDGYLKYVVMGNRFSGTDRWIYGVGSEFGLFGSIVDFPGIGYSWRLACFKQNDTIIYLNNLLCEKCFCWTWLGIDDKEKIGKKITIRNPVNEILEFSICELPSGEQIQYSVFNLAGVLLMKGSTIENPGQIFMRDIEKGLYLISFRTRYGSTCRKFVKSQ